MKKIFVAFLAISFLVLTLNGCKKKEVVPPVEEQTAPTEETAPTEPAPTEKTAPVE